MRRFRQRLMLLTLIYVGAFLTMGAPSFSNVLFDELFENHGTIMLIIDVKDGDIVAANEAAAEFYGFSIDDLKAMNIDDLNTLTEREVAEEMALAVKEERNYFNFIHRIQDGSERHVEVYSYPYRNEDGKTYLYSVIHDITDEKIAGKRARGTLIVLFIVLMLALLISAIYMYFIRASKNKLKIKSIELENLFNNIEEGFISVDSQGVIQSANPTALKLLKYQLSDFVGKPIVTCYRRFDETLEKTCQFNSKVLHKNVSKVILTAEDEPIYIEETVVPIYDIKGDESGLVIAFRDFTEKLARQKEIEFLSYHDQLTGLYNRRFFEEEISRLDVERNYPLAVIMFDVNGLKLINDAFGHAHGDALLQMMGEQLKQVFRGDDIVARIGGDEFVALLPQTKEGEVKSIITRFSTSLEALSINCVPVSVAVGYAMKRDAFTRRSEVLSIAEDRMYENKLHLSKPFKTQVIENIKKGLLSRKSIKKAYYNRVATLAKKIGTVYNLSETQLNQLEVAGRLHDIGKIAIDEAILLKAAPLTLEEKKVVEKHPEIGYHILKSVEEYADIAEWILSHHEHWDGTGYPRRIKAESINLCARILSVADAFVGLTAECDSCSDDEAFKKLKALAGTQFDPKVVEVLDEVLYGAAHRLRNKIPFESFKRTMTF